MRRAAGVQEPGEGGGGLPPSPPARDQQRTRQVTSLTHCRDIQVVAGRVSKPACFGAAPAPRIFYPEPAPDKREHNFGI